MPMANTQQNIQGCTSHRKGLEGVIKTSMFELFYKILDAIIFMIR